jgi:hypothetical protein
MSAPFPSPFPLSFSPAFGDIYLFKEPAHFSSLHHHKLLD